MSKTLYMIRHGETDANVRRVIQGQLGQTSLTARGRAEVDLVSKFLKEHIGEAIPLVWVSDLSRAAESAEAICVSLGLPPALRRKELRQRNWGSVQGQSYSTINGEMAYLGEPARELPADAEPIGQVFERLAALLKLILSADERAHIIVSHNELINYLLDFLVRGKLQKRHLLNGEIIVAEINDAGKSDAQPRSVFPTRLVYLPTVRSLLSVTDATELLRRHELRPVTSVSPLEFDNVVGVIVGDEKFGLEEARRFTRLRAVSRYGTGVDNVDVAGLHRERHVSVARTPGSNAVAVADFTVAAMTLMLRDVLHHVDGLRHGRWREGNRGIELSEATIGVVGCGAIGKEVIKRIRAQGSRVLVWNRTWTSSLEEEIFGVERTASLEDILRNCDVISVHVAYAEDTHHLINRNCFAIVKIGNHEPILINTSRGNVVDEAALLDALKEKIVRGAVLDVWSAEGERTNDIVEALRQHPSVFPTPHIAGLTTAAIRRSAIATVANLAALVDGRRGEIDAAICK